MVDQCVFSGVDLCCQMNNSAHHTEEIDRERLLVRRGQSFALTLKCTGNAPRDPDYSITLVLRLGNQVTVKVSDRQSWDPAQWWFSVQGGQGEMLLSVYSPPDTPIGKYSLAVLLVSSDGHVMEETPPESLYLLYNPWCKADAVYLPNDVLLKEYIMNENGLIYEGDADNITSKPWNFGQFEEDVVDICFEILDNSNSALKNPEMDIKNRADPVYVSRIISAMVNCNDDSGLLWGRWDGNYADGVAPSRWNGSVSILRRWSDSGRRPVQYGQCWVFAAVACTVMRCLGIPTRCITNFNSAHDVHCNLLIEYLEDENGVPIPDRSRPDGRCDARWNFHCWVESWMTRKDLPDGYDGWQVLDPTPQEKSDGVFCCGPCPVRAILEGEVGMKYDAPFIFAEVNADTITWRVNSDGTRTKVYVDKYSVGCNISTKSVYGDQREDVTALYKYPEGSAKEREVFERAGRQVSHQPGDNEDQSPQLKLSIKNALAVHGTDFDVIVEVQNVGCEEARAELTIKSFAITYNSLHRGDCQSKTARLTVPAQMVHKEVLRLRYDHYGACVSEHHTIRVTASLKMNNRSEVINTEANIQLKMPKLNIKVTGEAVVGQKVRADITFINPLPVPLKKGVFTVEGAGLTRATEIHVPNAIQPGGEVTVKLSFKPIRSGLRKLLVDFDSDKLMDVKGETTLMIRQKKYYWP